MDKPPYLQLVDHSTSAEHDEEFLPLPFYPWDERPPTLELEFDECATAIHLAAGSLPRAAAMLKVALFKINRAVKKSPRLQRIVEEGRQIAVEKAAGFVIDELDAVTDEGNPHIVRREWAVTKVLSSRMAQGHALSPAPTGQSSTAASLTLNQANRTMTFRWRTDADTTPADELDSDARTIEG